MSIKQYGSLTLDLSDILTVDKYLIHYCTPIALITLKNNTEVNIIKEYYEFMRDYECFTLSK